MRRAATTFAAENRAVTVRALVQPDYLAVPETASAAEAKVELRRSKDRFHTLDVRYIYALSMDGALQGVVPLYELVLNEPDASIAGIMRKQPDAVAVDATIDDVHALFSRSGYLALPVLTKDRKIVGVVLRTDVERVHREMQEQQAPSHHGLWEGEELRTMPWRWRLKRRLAWLSLNVVLSTAAASVIGLYEETLAQAIALAMFLPVVAAVGGNSGSQAAAISMRELDLRLITPDEVRWVLLKESGVALVNGAVLGFLLGVLAWTWTADVILATVSGLALLLNMTVSGCFGGVLPLVLRRMGLDPAMAAGLLLTTVSDMCGFGAALALAHALLAK